MGKMNYFSHEFTFDDRTLLHLQVVIAQRLRRGEPFFLSFEDRNGARHGIWISPTSPPAFRFDRAPAEGINPDWLKQLNREHGTGIGIVLTPEREGVQAT